MGQTVAAGPGEAVRGADAPEMKSLPVEIRAAKDRVVAKGFGTACHGKGVEREFES